MQGDPAKILGELLIGRVDNNARNALHDDIAKLAPHLHGKVLNVDVACVFGRMRGVDHVDGCLIVFVEDRRTSWRKSEFVEDGVQRQPLRDIGGISSGHEFSFGGTGSNSGLDLDFVSDGGTGKTEAETSDRAASVRATSGMGGIKESSEFKSRQRNRRDARHQWIRQKDSMGDLGPNAGQGS